MAPIVTRALLHRLIDSGAEDPVLYVNTDVDDEPELDVWAGAYVSNDTVVITRTDLLDWLGEEWADDDLNEYLPQLQETVHELVPEPGAHFTAWLVTDTTCLDGPDCDVTVLADEVSGYRQGEPAWTSVGDPLLHALTGVDARDGDIDEAQTEAEERLAMAGWAIAGTWEAAEGGYAITVERADSHETWTLQEAAEFMGAVSANTAMRALKRLGVEAVGRAPGRGGQSLYRPAEVMYAHATRPGQGARTDLKDPE